MRYLNLNILVAVNETDVNTGSRMALMVINFQKRLSAFGQAIVQQTNFIIPINSFKPTSATFI